MLPEDKFMLWFFGILAGGLILALIVVGITHDRIPSQSVLVQRLIDSKQGEWIDHSYCKEFVLKPFNVEKP